jgi:CBS-domain-containing membrane protein
VKSCFEDEELEQVTRNMAGNQLRRLPVLNRDMRLVGILSLGDVAIMQDTQVTGEALIDISEPSGEHSQTEGPRS